MRAWRWLTLGVALYIMLRVSAGSKVERIARAIAAAEGYGVTGAIPTVRNNPGNIKGSDGIIKTFQSVSEGWDALYHQVTLMLTGRSSFYVPTMTLAEIARIYTGEAAYMNWAANVARILGVTTDTRLEAV